MKWNRLAACGEVMRVRGGNDGMSSSQCFAMAEENLSLTIRIHIALNLR